MAYILVLVYEREREDRTDGRKQTDREREDRTDKHLFMFANRIGFFVLTIER